MRPILLIDGLNVFFRHFAANPTTNGNGDHVGGLVGFLREVKNLVDRFNPKEINVVWEGGGSLRRRSIDPNYKQGRRPIKLNRWYEDLPNTVSNRNEQINLLTKFLSHSPVRQIYIQDCEADDVIGYLSKYQYRDDELIIASSDKDYYQLISDRVRVWSPGQKRIIDENKVREKFGVSVQNFCAARCFCGDGSDGIIGAKNVGFKTITKRIPALSEVEDFSVNDIVNAARLASESSKIKFYKSIIEHEQVARKNWKLMYLGTSNLSATQIEKLNYQISESVPGSKKLEFMRLLNKLQISNFDVHSYYMSLKLINKN